MAELGFERTEVRQRLCRVSQRFPQGPAKAPLRHDGGGSHDRPRHRVTFPPLISALTYLSFVYVSFDDPHR